MLFYVVVATLVVAATCSRDAYGSQSADAAQTSLGSASAEERDASDSSADEAERVRLRAEYARLKAEHDELEARLASLQAEAAARKEHRGPRTKLSPWEGLGLYAISLALAVLSSCRWRGERR